MKLINDPMSVLTEAHSAEEQRNYTGSFCGFVLLNSQTYDLQALAARLRNRWDIMPQAEPMDEIIVEGGQEGDWLEQLLAEESVDILTEPEIKDDNLVFDIPGAMIAIGYMPTPVPEDEAVRNAANNYFWPEAVQVTKQHTAHLMIAVLPRDMAPIEAGKTYIKIISSCLEVENAIGVYTSGTVLEPQFYQQVVADMEAGALPLLNWIYIGLYETEQGNNAYTLGMDAFGKDELEVLGSERSAEELYRFLMNVAQYVLESDVTLKSGETIGFGADEKIAMKRGNGVRVEGHSIQFAY